MLRRATAARAARRGASVSARLRDCWDRLPARERLMLALLFYEGLTPTEAAVAMGCSTREIRRVIESRLMRVRTLVRRLRPAPGRSRRSAAGPGARRRAA